MFFFFYDNYENIEGFDKLPEAIQPELINFLRNNEYIGMPKRAFIKRDNNGVKYLRLECEDEWWWVKYHDLFRKGNESIDRYNSGERLQWSAPQRTIENS